MTENDAKAETYATRGSGRTCAGSSAAGVLPAVPRCVAWTRRGCLDYHPSWRRRRVVS